MTRIYRLHNHTSIKLTQQSPDYGSFSFWNFLASALAILSFMGVLLAAYIAF